jgi:hypothetical protein
MRKSLPLIGVMNNENKNHIYKDPRPICYAFYSLDHFELLESLWTLIFVFKRKLNCNFRYTVLQG